MTTSEFIQACEKLGMVNYLLDEFGLCFLTVYFNCGEVFNMTSTRTFLQIEDQIIKLTGRRWIDLYAEIEEYILKYRAQKKSQLCCDCLDILTI